MVKRIKTWLVIISLLAALLGPVVVAGVNHLLDRRLQNQAATPLPTTESTFIPPSVCIPSVDQSVFDELDYLPLNEDVDVDISLRMTELFTADQAARLLAMNSPAQINEEDTARRIEVIEYLKDSRIRTARDLVYSAYIFQHGDCSEHYLLANRLAEIAMDAGYQDALWIYAASLDRYLMSLDQPQKYGTQYTIINGEYQLYPVDPATTDAERASYNVPSLEEAIQKSANISSGQGNTQQSWLASWWLTIIGSGFAGLSVLIGLLDSKPNAPLGKFVLITALVIYFTSIVGHYFQIDALMRDVYEVNQKAWEIVNIVMVAVWLILASIETIRIIKNRSVSHII